MSVYKISYVLTTYNKLPYLKHVMQRLVAARLEDEEIIVCDGGSTDGTVEYLQKLYDDGQIQQYVSERDKGEAHGFNKAMLMANGDIIKPITDDDAFNYSIIRQAAHFMLSNSNIDVVIGYNAATYVNDIAHAHILEEPAANFQRWLNLKTPFWMIGLPLLIRKKSLALTGLFFSGVVLIDADFIYRITTLKTNIAWCTGVLSMHVSNVDGNYNRMNKISRKNELKRLRDYYVPKNKIQFSDVVRQYKLAIYKKADDIIEVLKKPIRPAKRAVFDYLGWKQISPQINLAWFSTGYTPIEGEDKLSSVYRVCDDVLTSSNLNRKIEFIYKVSDIEKVFQQ